MHCRQDSELHPNSCANFHRSRLVLFSVLHYFVRFCFYRSIVQQQFLVAACPVGTRLTRADSNVKAIVYWQALYISAREHCLTLSLFGEESNAEG